MTDRKGDYIQTYTHKAFWPLDPRSEEIDIIDIAHALSNICRYGGHTSNFYSVGEHSVLVSQSVPECFALWGLLHDASEAYLMDIPRPIKKYLTNYKEIESAIMKTVVERFDLNPLDEPHEVSIIDRRIVLDEKKKLMPGYSLLDWKPISEGPIGVSIIGYPPGTAKDLFLNRYYELIKGN